MELHSSRPPTYVRVLELIVIVAVGGLTAYLSTIRISEILAGEPPQKTEEVAALPTEPEPQPQLSTELPPTPPPPPPVSVATAKPPRPPEEPEPEPVAVAEPEPEPVKVAPKPVAVKPAKPAPKPVAPVAATPSAIESQPGYQARPFVNKGFQRRGFNAR